MVDPMLGLGVLASPVLIPLAAAGATMNAISRDEEGLRSKVGPLEASPAVQAPAKSAVKIMTQPGTKQCGLSNNFKKPETSYAKVRQLETSSMTPCFARARQDSFRQQSSTTITREPQKVAAPPRPNRPSRDTLALRVPKLRSYTTVS